MRNLGKDDLEFLLDMRQTVLTENMMLLSRGVMLFHEAGVIVTDDIEQEFIDPERHETVVETEHAQQKQARCEQIRDEVLSCAASLSDLSEKL